MITITCPTCSRIIKAPDEAAGKRGKCPGCKRAIEVPAETPAPVLLGGTAMGTNLDDGDFDEPDFSLPNWTPPPPEPQRQRPVFELDMPPGSELATTFRVLGMLILVPTLPLFVLYVFGLISGVFGGEVTGDEIAKAFMATVTIGSVAMGGVVCLAISAALQFLRNIDHWSHYCAVLLSIHNNQ